MRSTLAVLLLLAAFAATPARAQFGRAGQTDPVSRMDVRGGVMAALLIGSASDFLDGGTGVTGTLRYRVGPRDPLSLRGDVAWIPLEDDPDEPTGRTARNRLLLLGAGPELALAVGWVEPYLHLFGGALFNYAEVTTETGFGATQRESTLGWGGGAGVRVLLGGSRWPISVDVGAALLDFGDLGFARSPETTALSGGGLQNMLLAEVGMVALTAGISVGIF